MYIVPSVVMGSPIRVPCPYETPKRTSSLDKCTLIQRITASIHGNDCKMIMVYLFISKKMRVKVSISGAITCNKANPATIISLPQKMPCTSGTGTHSRKFLFDTNEPLGLICFNHTQCSCLKLGRTFFTWLAQCRIDLVKNKSVRLTPFCTGDPYDYDFKRNTKRLKSHISRE